MYSALFPRASSISFYGSCRAKFSTKLKIVLETLIPGVAEEVPSSRSSYAERFALHTQPDSVGNNENLWPVTSLGYFRRTSDDALYALILEAIILLALCSSISNV